jgi:hypothetical protein
MGHICYQVVESICARQEGIVNESNHMRRWMARCLSPVLLLVLAGLFGGGCGDSVKSYNLVVECDDAVANKSVTVDLIGATDLEKPEWESYSINKYWQPSDKKRGAAQKETVLFGPGKPKSYTFRLADPQWKSKWKQWQARRVTHLVVIADLSHITEDAMGNADPRRKTIPLNKKSWPGVSSFRIRVQDGGIGIDPLEQKPK